MASRTATLMGLNIVRGPDDVSSAQQLMSVELSLYNNTANTVIGGTDTLDFDVSSATAGIPAQFRNGKTISLIDAHVCGNALSGSTEYWATTALSTNTIQLTPKAVSDYSTNATLPANTTAVNRPYRVLCTVKLA